MSGLLDEFRKADTTFRRLTARCCFWPLAVLICSSRSAASASRSTCSSRSRIDSAPMPPRKYSPQPYGEPKRSLSSRNERLVVDDVLRRHRLEQVPDLAQALHRVLDVGLGVRDVGLHQLAHVLQVLLALVVLELLDVEVEVLGPDVVVVGEPGLRAGLEVVVAALERLAQLQQALLLLGRVLVERLVDLRLRAPRCRRHARPRPPTSRSTRRSRGPSRAPWEPCRAGSRCGSARP